MSENDQDSDQESELSPAQFEKGDIVIFEVPDGFRADDYIMQILRVTDQVASESEIRTPGGEITTISDYHDEVHPNDRMYKTRSMRLVDDELVPYDETEVGSTPESLIREPEVDDE